jgi:hypothetical protein
MGHHPDPLGVEVHLNLRKKLVSSREILILNMLNKRKELPSNAS